MVIKEVEYKSACVSETSLQGLRSQDLFQRLRNFQLVQNCAWMCRETISGVFMRGFEPVLRVWVPVKCPGCVGLKERFPKHMLKSILAHLKAKLKVFKKHWPELFCIFHYFSQVDLSAESLESLFPIFRGEHPNESCISLKFLQYLISVVNIVFRQRRWGGIPRLQVDVGFCHVSFILSKSPTDFLYFRWTEDILSSILILLSSLGWSAALCP